jgi:uncharacterized membrane protein (DUF106 family)
MAFFEAIGNAVNSALAPLLSLHPFWAIAIVALALSILITLIYKYTTNQKELKNIREETKVIQNEMKAAKGDMQKMTELNQKLLGITSKQMKHTLRSYIFTFLPVILIFGWLQGHMAYAPIMPGEQFTTTVLFKSTTAENITLSAPGLDMLSPATQEISDAQAVWKLKGDAGEYSLEYTYGKEVYARNVIITTEWKYVNTVPNNGISKESNVKSIAVNLKEVKPLNFLFGLQLNWFWTYFILTIIMTFPLRKFLKVY